MKLWLWLALVCFAPMLAPARAQDAAAGVECPSCKGKLRAVQECRACAGEGRIQCRTCRPPSVDFTLPVTEALTPEERRKLEDDLRRINESMAELDAKLGRTRVVGRVLCPANCAGGSVLLRPDLQCKYCAGKGSLACPDCDKGWRRCNTCAGRGKLQRLCDDCAGAGRLPDPAARASERRATCAWCDGSGARACRECDSAGRVVQVCGLCCGAKTVTCLPCVGTKLKPCSKCRGAGLIVGTPGLSPDRECTLCEKKGRLPCTSCVAEGRLACKACGGRGQADVPCPALASGHLRPCAGCALGTNRSWRVNAELLAARGAPQEAVTYLQVALERVDPFFDARIEQHVGPQAERDAIEKERAAAKKELEKRIAALRAKS